MNTLASRVLGTFFATMVAVAGSVSTAADLPPDPGRPTAPPGIESRAVSVGSPAPAISLPATTGGTWALASARDAGPVVLVFYRGDW
jgi:hypothetical protein